MKIRLGLLLMAALLLTAAPALAQKTPGVTDTEVVIGITTPLSGPGAAWGLPVSQAMEAWMKHVTIRGESTAGSSRPR